jgi:putative methyltransferase (TIGR04325 family)
MKDLILKKLRKYKPRSFGWFNDYKTWEEAKKACNTYDEQAIHEKLKSATLKVKNGEAAYERDGIIYSQIYYSWPLLSHLLLAASQNNNELSIIDFGGSLGTTFFQNKKYLNQLNKAQWDVIELGYLIETGKNEITENGLNFYYTIEQAFEANGKHNILIINGVFPYLENPYETFNLFKSFDFEYIIIESTYFNYEARDRICIQKTNPKAYTAFYPCWLLNYEKVKTTFSDQYDVFAEYLNDIHFYLDGERVEYRSVVFKKRMN